jgi:integrase
MAGKKRSVNSILPIERESLLQRIKNLESSRDRALFSLIYLTASRVSEILDIRKEQIKIEGDWMIVYNLPVFKTKRKKYRNIPIKLSLDQDFADFIMAYISKFEDTEPIFHINRKRVYEIAILKLGVFPHYLRHIRCSHLVKQPYNLKPYQLMAFVGWEKLQTSMNYVTTSMTDIMEQMGRL